VPGGDVRTAQRSNYYEALIEENAERAMRGLPPTAEYKRLDSLTDKFMRQIEVDDTLDHEGAAISAEVLEFLGAFERLLGPNLFEPALVN
jgi:hypothetical protein